MVKKLFSIALIFFLPLEAAGQTHSVIPKLPAASFSIKSDNTSFKERISGKQTLRIIALRIDFKEDDDPLTSGSGTFDYSVNSGAVVDPPPHDRSYFLDQLEALKRYYERVSGGNLIIGYDLFPAGDRDAYTSQQEIKYYNPNTTEEELDNRLSELLQDAVKLADADPDVDFSQYDAVIVFHAGVGSDFLLEDVALDPTPHDIPSVHLNLQHLRRTIGGGDPGYRGIAVAGGAHYITGGTILPETESKRDVEIGLLGIMTHQFAHELGMPSLFNTANGRPAIGKWGLMGVGFANFDGIIPAEPCAWSKVYMGWEVPEIVENGANLEVGASQSPGGTKIYKIPITPYEYFLVENRIRDYAADGLKFEKGASGVILEFDDYDFDIPGTGLLIWHIDETVIARGLSENRVNADPGRRGVDLEEADGSQDIGELFPGILPGFMTPENGLEWDAFYAGNNSEFTPATVPDSRSNSRGNSQIYITAISDSGQVMTFSVSRKFHVEDFPMFLGGDFTGMAPMWTKPSSPDSAKIVVTNKDGFIFALNGRNEPLVLNNATAVRHYFPGDSAEVKVPLFADAGSGTVFPPVIGTPDFPFEEFRNKLILTTDKPGLQIYSLVDSDGDNYGDLLHQADLPGQVSAPLMINMKIVAGFDDGFVRLYENDGMLYNESRLVSNPVTGFTGVPWNRVFAMYASGELGSLNISGTDVYIVSHFNSTVLDPFPPIFSDLESDQDFEIIIIGGEGDIEILDDSYYSNSIHASFEVAPVTGDIDGDGFREIITGSGSLVYSIDFNGVISAGFPVDISGMGFSGSISTDIILCDLNGDGKQNIIFGTDMGNLLAIDDHGVIVPGFPLSVGVEVVGSPAILRSSAGDKMELAALGYGGYLYLWDLETSYDDKTIAWGTFGGDNAHSRHNSESLAAVTPPESGVLMPPDRVFNWPNPNVDNRTNIRYYLNYQAKVKIRIYNQAGDFIAELSGPGNAQVDNEVTWQLDGVQSGVYYAAVSAVGNGMTERKIIKIAVVK